MNISSQQTVGTSDLYIPNGEQSSCRNMEALKDTQTRAGNTLT